MGGRSDEMVALFWIVGGSFRWCCCGGGGCGIGTPVLVFWRRSQLLSQGSWESKNALISMPKGCRTDRRPTFMAGEVEHEQMVGTLGELRKKCCTHAKAIIQS